MQSSLLLETKERINGHGRELELIVLTYPGDDPLPRRIYKPPQLFPTGGDQGNGGKEKGKKWGKKSDLSAGEKSFPKGRRRGDVA